MAENQKNDGTMPNGDAAGAAPEQPRREWITPQFESIPLSEAMGPVPNRVVQDGANLYS